LGLVEDDTLVLHLEPLHGVFFGHPVLDANARLAPAPASNTVTSPLQNDVKVHTINTSRWVIPGKKKTSKLFPNIVVIPGIVVSSVDTDTQFKQDSERKVIS
jgi:hypothetical protein